VWFGDGRCGFAHVAEPDHCPSERAPPTDLRTCPVTFQSAWAHPLNILTSIWDASSDDIGAFQYLSVKAPNRNTRTDGYPGLSRRAREMLNVSLHRATPWTSTLV
jgi:hypothetical protein